MEENSKAISDEVQEEHNSSTIFQVLNYGKSEQATFSMLSTPKTLSFTLVAEVLTGLIYHLPRAKIPVFSFSSYIITPSFSKHAKKF